LHLSTNGHQLRAFLQEEPRLQSLKRFCEEEEEEERREWSAGERRRFDRRDWKGRKKGGYLPFRY